MTRDQMMLAGSIIGALATELAPPFDVQSGPIDTVEAMHDAIAKNEGRMVVWAGKSDRTVYGTRFFNHCFRAWHDQCHLDLGAAFHCTDEASVCAYQQEQIDKLMVARGYPDRQRHHVRLLLDAEINGQCSYATVCGHFPGDQCDFDYTWINSGAAYAYRVDFGS